MPHFINLLLTCLLAAHASAGEIKIAAAADLKFALDEIIQKYQALHADEKVSATYGASGKLVTQIQEGAPFDLFFSADTEKAETLVKAGITSGGLFQYAHGHLVLWARKESSLQLDGSMRCLLDPGVRKIAVANPATAPYGKAAEIALKKADILPRLKGKLVNGDNIAQAAQFVESAAADVGVIAKSLALSPALKNEGRFVDVDAALYTPLPQAGVLLKGKNVAAARKFEGYFLGPEARNILTGFGLSR